MELPLGKTPDGENQANDCRPSASQAAPPEHPTINLAKMRPHRHKHLKQHPKMHPKTAPAPEAPNCLPPSILPSISQTIPGRHQAPARQHQTTRPPNTSCQSRKTRLRLSPAPEKAPAPAAQSAPAPAPQTVCPLAPSRQ